MRGPLPADRADPTHLPASIIEMSRGRAHGAVRVRSREETAGATRDDARAAVALRCRSAGSCRRTARAAPTRGTIATIRDEL